MPELIDQHQTAFVEGRYIAENFLAAREVLHHVSKCASPAVLLKLDFTKAFDTLDWDFLFHVMRARGFPTKFIHWVSSLLSTATSRIQINGRLSPSFAHKRGLRQGDPLSPYLFILAADVFQQMMVAISASLAYHLTPKLKQPAITFQYADDTIIVASVLGSTLRSLLLVVHCFGQSSGLMVNFTKSSFVPIGIPAQHIQFLQALLGCNPQSLPITYLGMPLSTRAPKREDFAPILHKMERRLAGWKARFLSRAGKLQLVKSVLSTMPTYFMSCFALPKWLLARMDVIRRKFLWSRPGDVPSIHLMNWKAVCLSTRNGGLGVVNLQLQNTSLLLRWWWRLYAPGRMLWNDYATLIYAQSPVHVGPKLLSLTGSFFWRSLLKIKPIFHSCTRVQLCSGEQTSFWFDAWGGQPLSLHRPRPLPLRTISVLHAKYCLHRLLSYPLTLQEHAAHEYISQFTPAQGDDRFTWQLTPTGMFTVKSVYKVLSQAGKTLATFVPLWKAKVLPSMRLFFFFLVNNRLLTHDVMQRRHLPCAPSCVMCSPGLDETAMHLFFQCPFAVNVWQKLSFTAGYNLLTVHDTPLLCFLRSFPADKDKEPPWMATFIIATYSLWRERNNRIFRQSYTPLNLLVDNIVRDSSLCLTYC